MSVQSVVLGNRRGEYVCITALARQFEPRGDEWDDDWLVCRVSLRVSGFRGRYPVTFGVSEIANLATILREQQGSSSGQAIWEPMEPWLALTFEARGELLEMRGLAWERAEVGNGLRFSIELGASDLQRALEDIDRLVGVFPVLIQPAGHDLMRRVRRRVRRGLSLSLALVRRLRSSRANLRTSSRPARIVRTTSQKDGWRGRDVDLHCIADGPAMHRSNPST